VFDSALMLLFATCICCGSAFVSIKQHVIGSSNKNAVSAKIKMSGKASHTYCTKHSSWESSDVPTLIEI